MKMASSFILLITSIAMSACSISPMNGDEFNETDTITLETVVWETHTQYIDHARWSIANTSQSGSITSWTVLDTDSIASSYGTNPADEIKYSSYSGSRQLWSSVWTQADTGYAQGCTGSNLCPKHAIIKSELVLDDDTSTGTSVYDRDNLSCMSSNWWTGGGQAVRDNCAASHDGIIVIYAN